VGWWSKPGRWWVVWTAKHGQRCAWWGLLARAVVVVVVAAVVLVVVQGRGRGRGRAAQRVAPTCDDGSCWSALQVGEARVVWMAVGGCGCGCGVPLGVCVGECCGCVKLWLWLLLWHVSPSSHSTTSGVLCFGSTVAPSCGARSYVAAVLTVCCARMVPCQLPQPDCSLSCRASGGPVPA